MQSITPLTTNDFKGSSVVIGKILLDIDGTGNYQELPDVIDFGINTNIEDEVSRFCAYSFSITCLNTSKRYFSWNTSSSYYNWLKQGRRIKIYAGIKSGGNNYYYQWLIGRVDNYTLPTVAGEEICTIIGRDFMRTILDYKLYYPNTFCGGTVYLDTINGKTVYYLPNSLTGGAWDVRGAFRIGSKDVGSESTSPRDIYFNTAGTRMYVVGNDATNVFQYDLSTAFSVSTAIYNGDFFDVSGEDAEPGGITFNSDGTKMYIAGMNNQGVYQYDLGTAWDVTTAVYNTKHIDVSGETLNPRDMAFSSDGKTMFVISLTPDFVFQYTLTTAWDVTTATYATKSVDISSEEINATSVFFNNDGSEMFILGGADTVYKYTLGTPWDLSTATYSTISKSLANNGTAITGLYFKSDGKKMYVADTTLDLVFEYTLDDSSIGITTGVYKAAVDDIDPRDGETEADYSILTEDTDFVYDETINTITFGAGWTPADDGTNNLKIDYLLEQDIEEGIARILLAAGIFADEAAKTTWLASGYVTATGETIKKIRFEVSCTAFKAITLLAEGAQYRFYFDYAGNPIFKPKPTIGVSVDTLTDDCITNQEVSEDVEEIYNDIVVVGDTDIEAIATASAADIAKTGGKRTLEINNHLIQTTVIAQAIADAYLADYKDQKTKLRITKPTPPPYEIGDTVKRDYSETELPYYAATSALISYIAATSGVHGYFPAGISLQDMLIRKINLGFSAGNYVSVLELES